MNKRGNDILRFVKRIALFSVPLVVVLALYVAVDPFKVIRSYDSYYAEHYHGGIALNAGYVSKANFDNNYSAERYNSFIFGNSRSIYYSVGEWMKYLPEGSKPYHFDASAESIYGIQRKIVYLLKQDVDIENVLIVLDRSVLEQARSLPGHLYAVPPGLGSVLEDVKFHTTMFGVFLNPRFMYAAADYHINGKLKDYMLRDNLLSSEDFTYDRCTNEQSYDLYERRIAEGTYYTPARRAVFRGVQHPDSVAPQAIGEEQKPIIESLAHDLAQAHSKVKIVISPLYDQIRLNPADVAELKLLFGDGNVYDFSGVNHITADYRNYYEASHYRPHVATEIMKNIY